MELYQDGKIVGVQKMNKRNALRVSQGKKPIDFSGITKHCWKNNRNGVPLFVQVDMDATGLPDDFELYPKTEQSMLTVLQLVADGKTLRSIGQTPGLPPVSVVMRWCSKDEDFKDALTEARKSRAEVYHDAIEHVAFTTKENTARSSKVKIDALKFLAGANDGERFGNVKAGEGSGPVVTFVINTGITDQPVTVEGTKVDAKANPADDRDGVLPETPPAGDPQQA